MLGEAIRHHVSKYEKDYPAVDKVLNRVYADDLSCSVETPLEAMNLYKQAKSIMLQGGFNLRKWMSNDKILLNEIRSMENEAIEVSTVDMRSEAVREDDQTYSEYAIGSPTSDKYSKVLGVNWDSDSDKLLYEISHIIQFASSLPVTKRSVLKVAAKLFDPMGCITALTINFKILFQQLYKNKINWDDTLTGPNHAQYMKSINDMRKVQKAFINRYLFRKDGEVELVEIHGFSDASERAYAAVVYLRVLYESGEVEVNFISSKAKVSPISNKVFPD